ncbi:MAG TPA: 5'-3' exonuclease H3TH domain-containing protein [Verrucomicrobiae bacterium]|nr:5'-3' exonuclease H3TH domain-containing protein [Verrucomicrobiae bacterium]
MQSSPTSEFPAQRRLLLVDGHAFAYRAFFAIRSLSSPEGAATNAIYGFIRMLGRMQAKVRPSHLAVVWDGGLASERTTLLPEYKAQRPEMPRDLEQQLDQIVAYLHAAGVVSILQDSCEADDLIAALTRRAVTDGLEVVIASSDKDFMQLVSPEVRLLNPQDKTDTLWGAEEVRAKTGVEPTQIVDWLSLTGDAVDNIRGVPGVGAKTATNLLHQFGSVDGLYHRLEEVHTDRLRVNLQAAEEVIRRNQKLVRLKCEVPCEVSLEELVCKPGDAAALRGLFARWGFKSLLRELDQTRLPAGDFFPETAGAC